MKTHSPFTRRPNAMAAALLAGLLCASLATPMAHAQGNGNRPAQGSAGKFRGEPVTLNFVNADIEGVSRAMGAILKQQFIVDPRVKGNITVYSEQPLSPNEAYLNYLAALRGLGFTVIEAGGLFKVVPEADAKLQTSSVAVGPSSRRGDQIMTQIFTLNHENANNLVPVLRPLISPNNTINANPGNNSLVITDYADNLQRIAKIIASMDVANTGDVEVINLKYAVASDIGAMVQKMSDTGAPGAPGMPGGVSVLVDSRSNALLVKAPNPARLANIRALVAKLDQPMQGGSGGSMGNIWVVYLKNADAAKLAAVLRAAYSANSSGGAGAGGMGSGGGFSQPQTPNAAAVPGGNANGQSAQATAPLTPSAGPSTGGFIQADPSTNSLIITAPEPVYRQLRAVIDQLDSRRAQVYIESMIVKVDAQKSAALGFQWQGLVGKKGDSNGVILGTNYTNGGNNIVNLSAAAAAGNAQSASAISLGSGLNVGLVHKFGNIYTLGALAQFMEANVDANILSTPNLVSLDNEEAKIVIGQNVPFITGTFTGVGSGNNGVSNPFQTVERKDVGLTLRVKPQIGEAGTVRMTIYQENSAVVPNSNSNAGPTTDKSSIETTVVVDDGQIMVLGGLLKDEYTGTAQKVPGLGDVPILGGLFRSDDRTRTKTNLMVFLRPVVIRTQEAANALTMDRYDVIRAKEQESTPKSQRIINDVPILPERPATKPTPPANAVTPDTLINNNR